MYAGVLIALVPLDHFRRFNELCIQSRRILSGNGNLKMHPVIELCHGKPTIRNPLTARVNWCLGRTSVQSRAMSTRTQPLCGSSCGKESVLHSIVTPYHR